MDTFIFVGTGGFEDNFNKGINFMLNSVVGLADNKRDRVMLAFEELYVNVLKYNVNCPSLIIELRTQCDGKSFAVTISDNGARFNPLEADQPDLTLSVEEREIGGLGIFLFRELMDFADYRYEDGHNIIRFGVRL